MGSNNKVGYGKHIVILTPCYNGDYDQETKKCILKASQQTNFKIHTFTTQEVYIHRGRRILLQELLDFNKEQKVDYVLWLDSDITFKPEDLTVLVEELEKNKLPCLSAIYFNRHKNHHTMFCYGDPEYGFNWNNSCFYELSKVDGVGFGFFLLKTKTLVKYALQYNSTEWFDSSRWYPSYRSCDQQICTLGEDLDFCMKLSKIGLPIHVTNKVIVKHKGIGLKEHKNWKRKKIFFEHCAVKIKSW